MLCEALRKQVIATFEGWKVGKKRQRRIEEMRQLVEAACAPGSGFGVVEQVAVKLLGLSAQALLEEELQLRADRADRRGPDGRLPRSVACPVCGRDVVATFSRRRSRTIESSVGELRFARAVYSCCGRGKGHTVMPADAAIGIRPGTRLSPWLEELTTAFGAELPFQRAQKMLAKTVETPCATSTVHEATIDAGAGAETRMLALSQQIRRCPPDAPMLPDPAGPDDTLVIQPDGASCPTIGEGDGTGEDDEGADPVTRDARRKPDGRPGTRHREVKSAVLYKLRDHVVKEPARSGGPGRGRIRRCFVCSRIGYWMEFAWLLYTLALQLGARKAKRVVILGDGADWIGWIATQFFTGAIRILDFWHAMEHIARAGRAAFGTGSPELAAWLRVQRKALRAGKAVEVVAAIRKLATGRCSPALDETIRQEVTYLRKRLDQMAYPRFEALGLPIASGAIEGFNRHVVKNRFDAGGMRWHPESANRLLALIAERRNAEAAAMGLDAA